MCRLHCMHYVPLYALLTLCMQNAKCNCKYTVLTWHAGPVACRSGRRTCWPCCCDSGSPSCPVTLYSYIKLRSAGPFRICYSLAYWAVRDWAQNGCENTSECAGSWCATDATQRGRRKGERQRRMAKWSRPLTVIAAARGGTFEVGEYRKGMCDTWNWRLGYVI